MIISVKTENAKLLKIAETPVIGTIAIFLIAMAPVPLLFIANALFPFTETSFLEHINIFITGIWNLFLFFALRVKISIFFIPCWALFIVMGLLTYFHII